MTINETQTVTGPKTHLLAITSLVVAILGLTPILPFVGSVAGIVTGMIARKEIRAQPDRYTGEGTARAGVIIGWVGVGLLVLVCAGFLLFLPIRTINTSGIQTLQITAVP